LSINEGGLENCLSFWRRSFRGNSRGSAPGYHSGFVVHVALDDARIATTWAKIAESLKLVFLEYVFPVF